MTQEEKAKAYDEAIKKLHEIITMDNHPVLPKEIGEYLFPELAESEDEKTRKELLEEIESIIPHEDETDSEGLILPSYHTRIDRYKSYLEKQKEYEQAEKDLGWHPSTEHPPVDEEVIVLTDIITKGGLNVGFGMIAFGHIVDKDIAVDYDGWNIEGVRYWMPMPEIPKK